MRLRRVRFKDTLGFSDSRHGLRGLVQIGRNKIVDEVNVNGRTEFRTRLGEVLFEKENIIPIGGYEYVFSKLANLPIDGESTLRVGDLNETAPLPSIGSNPVQYVYGDYISADVAVPAQHHLFGFMVGDGGALEDNITARATDYKRRELFHAIPFRLNTDGTYIDPQKYYGKFSDVGGTTSYYVKTFDLPTPHKVHSWVTDNPNQFEPVDETVFSSTSTIPIESYIEFSFSIREDDVRGYFNSTGATPRINELGLVSGLYNPNTNDWDRIMLFSHLTYGSILLPGATTIEVLYRVYAR